MMSALPRYKGLMTVAALPVLMLLIVGPSSSYAKADLVRADDLLVGDGKPNDWESPNENLSMVSPVFLIRPVHFWHRVVDFAFSFVLIWWI
jgi:hypothetical protein